MIRLFILLTLIACIKVEAPTIVITNIPLLNKKPIALVKYKDTIYHCENIIKTQCGYSIHCGNMSVHCANDLTMEYLK